MRDVINKLLILRDMLRAAYGEWRHGVWDRDLDARWCCDGRECACGGSTVREIFRYR